MKAALVYAINEMRIEEKPKPQVPQGSILVRVKACAICGTDLRIYRKGDHRAEYPVIIGHEIAGIVEEVDPSITDYKPGDRVCIAPGHGCGHCEMCLRGYPNVCLTPHPSLGYKADGGFAEYIAVPENIFRLGFVNRIPDSLSFIQASMSEIIACCLNAQQNSPVHEGDIVLVLGSGPAGIIHTRLSKLNGAKKVLLSQRSPERLSLAAERFDIDRTIASSQENLFEAVMEETSGRGADVIYVCAPSPEAQKDAFKLISPRGRINFFGGLPKGKNVIDVDSNFIHYKEVFIGGASSSLPEGNREALRILEKRLIDPDKLITDVLPFDEIQKGFDIAESRKRIKIVIKFE